MHQIRKTSQFNLEGKTFKLELETHHHGATYSECEIGCPKDWQIHSY